MEFDKIIFCEDKMEHILALVNRITPKIADKFKFEVIDDDNGHDVCEFYGEDGKIVIRGNNNVALAHAYGNYIEQYCNTYITHCGSDMIDVSLAPLPREHFKKTILHNKRVYLDYITSSNSTWMWNWKRWEKEIDFMAMQGINMALNIVGNDAILYNTLVRIGLSERSAAYFVSGPAFYAWQITGKIDMYIPRNDFTSYDEQLTLAKKIFNRMNELDISPILSSFNGQISKKIIKLFGKVKNYKNEQWADFPTTYKTDILDNCFKKIFSEYMFFQEENIGKADYYMCNYLCNFNAKTGKPKYMRSIGSEFDRLMNFCVDSDHPCVVFPSDGYNRFFLEGISKCDKLVLDLDGSQHDVTNFFDGNDCVIGNSHNNSSHISLRGDVHKLVKNEYLKIYKEHDNVKGVGFFPELLEQNPFYHELMFKIMTCSGKQNLSDFIKDYSVGRYGEENENIIEAYNILIRTCYSEKNSETDIGSAMCARPAPMLRHTAPYDKIEVAYDNKELFECIRLLLNSKNKTHNMLYTLVFVVRQALDNYAYEIYKTIMDSYLSRDKQTFDENSRKFLDVFYDLDELLRSLEETNSYAIFQKLKSGCKNDQDEISTTLNYLASHTIWGPLTLDCQRYDCCWIVLSDFIVEYYASRWEKFFEYLSNNFGKKGVEMKSAGQFYDRDHFSYNSFFKSMAEYEKKFILDFVPHSQVEGNTYDIANKLFEKYSKFYDEKVK